MSYSVPNREPEQLRHQHLASFEVKSSQLLLFLVIATFILLLSSLGLLSPHATRSSTTVGRGKSEINMFLGVKADDKGGDVDNLFSDAA
jgi:hypothetical protein